MTAPYTYGGWRTYGTYDASWHEIQPTKGTYTGSGSDQANMVLTWTAMDTMVANAQAVGVSTIFTMWGLPVWTGTAAKATTLSLSGTVGAIVATAGVSTFVAGDVGKTLSVGNGWGVITAQGGTTANVTTSRTFPGTSFASGEWFVATEDAWDLPGGAEVPLNKQYVTDFVTALLQRYNAVTRKIACIDLWNEPFPVNVASWNGTQAQLVQMCWTAYSAAKAVDSGVKVLAPAFNNITSLTDFLAAQDPVSLKFGYDTFDYLNIHCYHAGPNKALTGTDLYYTDVLGVAAAQRTLVAAGQASRPVVCTEWGIDEVLSADTTAFFALTAAQRKLYIQRMFVMAALDGMQLFCPFSGSTLAGNYETDTTGVIAAVTDVQAKIAGKTLISGGWYADGSVTVTTSEGNTYVW